MAQSPRSNPGDEWVSQIDSEQVFQLIDTLLPFEICLYHQVLPLSVEGSRLNLGMVNPTDSSATDYIRRVILAYINYSPVPRQIPIEVHQAMLSAYLNYVGKQKPAAALPANKFARSPRSSKSNAKVIPPPSETANPLEAPILQTNPNPSAATEASLEELPVNPPPSAKDASPLWLLGDISALEVDAPFLDQPISALRHLPQEALLQELLARMLSGGIGRLFLERRADYGRVLWSQNGELQDTLDNLHLETFQGIIDQLKTMANLPLLPVQKPRQVEMERLYQGTHLLLRLRVMRGASGEEATLQALRGEALRFHQQLQVNDLGQEALTLAQQLQHKLADLGRRLEIDPSLLGDQKDALNHIEEIVRAIGQNLHEIQQQG